MKPFCQVGPDIPAKPRRIGPLLKRPWLLAGGVFLAASLLLLWKPKGDNPPSAQASLKEVLMQFNQPRRDPDRLRQEIFKLRRDYPGTPEAIEAASLLTRPEVPALLDGLQAENIPADERLAKQPRELVAVLGKKGQPSVWSVSFSSDGNSVAGGGIGAVIRLWDPLTRKAQRSIEGPGNIIQVLRFSPDGLSLASFTKTDEMLRIWDLDKGIVRFAVPASVPVLAYSPNGKTIASAGADHRLILINTADGKMDKALLGHVSPISALSYGPDGRTLASGSSDGTVILWDTAAGSSRFTLRKHTDRVDSVVFSPDGRKVATASGTNDRSLKIFDVASGTEETSFQALTPLFVWAHGGKSLVGTISSSSLRQWDASGKQLWEVTLPVGRIMDIALAPDGRHLATANDNGTVFLVRLPPPPASSTSP